jgi:hypothetical protein
VAECWYVAESVEGGLADPSVDSIQKVGAGRLGPACMHPEPGDLVDQREIPRQLRSIATARKRETRMSLGRDDGRCSPWRKTAPFEMGRRARELISFPNPPESHGRCARQRPRRPDWARGWSRSSSCQFPGFDDTIVHPELPDDFVSRRGGFHDASPPPSDPPLRVDRSWRSDALVSRMLPWPAAPAYA